MSATTQAGPQGGAEPRIYKVRKGSLDTPIAVEPTLRETMEMLLREFDAREANAVCGYHYLKT